MTPDEVVTPDLAVVLRPEYGVAAEAKASFPQDTSRWERDLRQLLKYDDTLTGWPGPIAEGFRHDLVLLLHNSRKVAVSDFVAERQADYPFHRAFAIVAFSRTEQQDHYLALERYWGRLSDGTIDERLRRVVQIPFSILVEQYSIRFYDADPPPPYLMAMLWDSVFPAMRPVESYKERTFRLVVTADEVTRLLQEKQMDPHHGLASDHRPLPKRAWVADALERFRKWGFAARKDPTHYEVTLKRIRDPLETFIRKAADDDLAARDKQRRQGTDKLPPLPGLVDE